MGNSQKVTELDFKEGSVKRFFCSRDWLVVFVSLSVVISLYAVTLGACAKLG